MEIKITVANERLRSDKRNKSPLNSPLYFTDVHRISIERAETVKLLSFGGSDVYFTR